MVVAGAFFLSLAVLVIPVLILAGIYGALKLESRLGNVVAIVLAVILVVGFVLVVDYSVELLELANSLEE